MKHLIIVFLLFGVAGLLVSGCAMDAADSVADNWDDGDPWPEPDPKIWLDKDPPTLDPSLKLIVEGVEVFETIEGIDGGPAVDPPDIPNMQPLSHLQPVLTEDSDTNDSDSDFELAP